MASAIIIGIIALSVWLWALISHLQRRDLSDCDKIVWTIVLCTLNIFGAILYLFMAPSGESKVRSEEELKEYFNSCSK
ncbi:MAG: PLD nuclease N-terminal domain-containing protein [Chthoniobacterales bacterium]